MKIERCLNAKKVLAYTQRDQTAKKKYVMFNAQIRKGAFDTPAISLPELEKIMN